MHHLPHRWNAKLTTHFYQVMMPRMYVSLPPKALHPLLIHRLHIFTSRFYIFITSNESGSLNCSQRMQIIIYFQGAHTKLWGGRFSEKTDTLLEKLNASIAYDKRMWSEDIQVGSLILQIYKVLHTYKLLDIQMCYM